MSQPPIKVTIDAAGNSLTDARDHAQPSAGNRAPIVPMQATKPTMSRRIRVHARAPFVPDHHGHARSGLKGHET